MKSGLLLLPSFDGDDDDDRNIIDRRVKKVNIKKRVRM
jgi:hypothetical protein